MAEEQRWEEQGSHRLCANNCGFFGSPTTHNLCSKCYNDQCIKEQQSKDAHIAMENTLLRRSESSFSPPTLASPSIVPLESTPPPAATVETTISAASPKRCGACRKRVGLTGFPCKCGVTFCGSHRYPEKHGCGFDYKALGREEIAKANPMVKAEKLHKI